MPREPTTHILFKRNRTQNSQIMENIKSLYQFLIPGIVSIVDRAGKAKKQSKARSNGKKDRVVGLNFRTNRKFFFFAFVGFWDPPNKRKESRNRERATASTSDACGSLGNLGILS